jgi:hypothetical protein
MITLVRNKTTSMFDVTCQLKQVNQYNITDLQRTQH